MSLTIAVVSDPDHVDFGQHLDELDVNDHIRPHEETNALVHDWLKSFGVEVDRLTYSLAGDWIHIAMSIGEVVAGPTHVHRHKHEKKA